MKRVHLSGAQKRKLAEQKDYTVSVVKAKSRKLTNYLVSVKQQVEQDFTDTINPLDKSTIGCSANPDAALVLENEICCDPLQSAEDDDKDEDDKDEDDKDEDDKINQAVDPGLFIDFSADDVAYICEYRNTSFSRGMSTSATSKWIFSTFVFGFASLTLRLFPYKTARKEE